MYLILIGFVAFKIICLSYLSQVEKKTFLTLHGQLEVINCTSIIRQDDQQIYSSRRGLYTSFYHDGLLRSFIQKGHNLHRFRAHPIGQLQKSSSWSEMARDDYYLWADRIPRFRNSIS